MPCEHILPSDCILSYHSLWNSCPVHCHDLPRSPPTIYPWAHLRIPISISPSLPAKANFQSSTPVGTCKLHLLILLLSLLHHFPILLQT
ncbi:hypothetical protein NE237_007995 [Protea cynaroides]|uniref:Uncharacterized protein n=1 Tax=Protea cynaroides TaxID=273540 RepID=A0A9Q0KR33_9MAGN|nr:hypothetical protein NE237_007995 [Protea cynaroides]